MTCPLCEHANPDDALECAECGKPLLEELPLEEEPELLPDHEPTRIGENDLDQAFAMAALDEQGVPALELLEPTEVFNRQDAVAAVEPLEIEGAMPVMPAAPSGWTSELLEMESGRDEDLAPKTPAPVANGPCPWCGFPGDGAVCNNCGRRRNRYSTAPVEAVRGQATEQTQLCPACFTRVLNDERCAECKAPLPRAELF